MLTRALAITAGLAAAALVVLVLTSGGGRGPQRRTQTPTTPSRAAGPPVITSAPAGSVALPAPTVEQFGVNVNVPFNDREAPQRIDAQLRALRQTGATTGRSDALWERIEPGPPVRGIHSYQWAFDDEVAGALAANGLRWLSIIDYAAGWAREDPSKLHSPPRSAADFASFAAALAARYGSAGSFWQAHPRLSRYPIDTYEIWNEPDNAEFWAPVPNAGQYAELYLRARAAIHAADPPARVIIGGLTSLSSFLPAMLKARPDLRGHIDGVAIHPYAVDPRMVLAAVRTARSAMTSLGLGSVPLYVTEFGWTTRPRGALDWLAPRLRPAFIASTITELGHLDCGVAATLLYTWVTREQNPSDSQDWFGVHRPSGGSSADSDAVAEGIRRAREQSSAIRLCAGH